MIERVSPSARPTSSGHTDNASDLMICSGLTHLTVSVPHPGLDSGIGQPPSENTTCTVPARDDLLDIRMIRERLRGTSVGWHTPKVSRDRDVKAFHDRANHYEEGWRGRMHREIAIRSADVALSSNHIPRCVLDLGCGTGLLLRLLADRLPEAETLFGIDAAAGMIAAAKSVAKDDRLRFSQGVAESLPYPDASFDLVISTTSFDHWEDQGAGLCEAARVLAQDGHFVLTDLFSMLLVPTMLLGHRDRARTRRRAERLLRAAGFRTVEWHSRYRLIIGSVVATKR
jgi:SAM-dependent methyltransferase